MGAKVNHPVLWSGVFLFLATESMTRHPEGYIAEINALRFAWYSLSVIKPSFFRALSSRSFLAVWFSLAALDATGAGCKATVCCSATADGGIGVGSDCDAVTSGADAATTGTSETGSDTGWAGAVATVGTSAGVGMAFGGRHSLARTDTALLVKL